MLRRRRLTGVDFAPRSLGAVGCRAVRRHPADDGICHGGEHGGAARVDHAVAGVRPGVGSVAHAVQGAWAAADSIDCSACAVDGCGVYRHDWRVRGCGADDPAGRGVRGDLSGGVVVVSGGDIVLGI